MRAWRKQFWGSLSGGQKRGERLKSRPPFCKFVSNMYRRWFCLHISGYMQELRRQSRHDWLKPECYGRSHPSDVTCSGPPSKFCGLKPSPRGAVYLYANRGKAIPFFGLIRRKNVIRLGWRHDVRHSMGGGQGSGPGLLTVSGLLRPRNPPPSSLLVKSKREAALLGAAVFCSEPVFKHFDESFVGRKR